MYRKILGLNHLERLEFPVPKYQIIAIDEDGPEDIEGYIHQKINAVEVPYEPGDSIGVTIRVSLPTRLDKEAKHGGLHNTNEKEILQTVLSKYKEYGFNTKIILQHTIDAKCSGTVYENKNVIIEAILGDAPPLLEGETRNIERWTYSISHSSFTKNQPFLLEGKESEVLSPRDLNLLIRYIKRAVRESSGNIYLEWSISKKGQIYFYEYGEFP